MHYHLYTGADGQSHFEELEIPPGVTYDVPIPQGEDFIFRRQPMPGWHNAPCRQFVLTLTGRSEIGLGDGSSQQFGPGDMMLAEDLTGEATPNESLRHRGYLYLFRPNSMTAGSSGLLEIIAEE